MYMVLLRRLLPEGVRVNRIFQCNGRAGVFAAAEDRRYKGSKSIFMVDGDIFLLSGEKLAVPSNVYVIDAYSIENLVVCKRSITEFAFTCHPDKSYQQIVSGLQLDAWFAETERKLLPLFVIYAAVMHFGSQIKTTSMSGLAFVEKGSAKVSMDLVRKRINEIRTLLDKENGRRQVGKVVKVASERAKKFPNKIDLVSGKSYVIPLLLRHLSDRTGFSDKQGFCMRLFHCCDLARANHLRQFILNVIS